MIATIMAIAGAWQLTVWIFWLMERVEGRG